MLYEMLAGTPPFTGPSAAAVLARQVLDPVPPLATVRPDLPASIGQAVSRALAKSPADRFPSMTDFLEALTRASAASPPPRPERSVVVLPFANLSPDPDNEYFADGLTEDVIMDLSRSRALAVISRNSSMLLKGTAKDTRTIGRELNVGYVVEGTVRRAGSTLRVTAQLIDAERDVHLWAERYSGTIDDVFGMQEQLARRIVEGLGVALAPEESRRLRERPVSDPRALDCYHRARHEFYRFTSDGISRALRLLETGIEIVGENAFLRAAQCQTCLMAIGGMVTVTRQMLRQAQEYLGMALRVDAEAPEVLFARGSMALQEGRLEEAARILRHALRLRPNDPDTLINLAVVYGYVGRPEAAEPLLDRARALDPLTPVHHAIRGFIRLVAADFADSYQHYWRWTEADPHTPMAWLCRVYVSAFMDRIEEATAHARHLVGLAPDSLAARLARLFVDAGLRRDREAAGQLADPELLEAADCDVQMVGFLTWTHALLGDVEGTCRWMPRLVALGGFSSTFWRAVPQFRPLFDDPRFRKYLEEVDRRSAAFEV